jgi:hypothetical protein
MSATYPITRALADHRLLGAGMGDDLASWRTWLVLLKSAFALPLDGDELATFRQIAGDRAPPGRRVRELWVVAGRRSGKSRMAAAIGLYLGLFQRHRLAAGETGHVVVMSASTDQARMTFSYVKGFVEASSVLRREVVGIRSNANASEIKFRNGITVAVHPSSFRTIRGRTIVGAVFDEVSYWRDEDSANPDLEVYRAVLPALVQTNGMLVSISSPYRRLGLMFTKHCDHFGIDRDDVLAVQAATATLNPLIDRREVEAASAADPEAARSEWAGEFRDDISGFLDDALIDAAVDHGRPLELPPAPRRWYHAFVDPSGGRGDAFALCIAHREAKTERFIVDVVRHVPPPFDPSTVVAEFSKLLRDYGCREVRGDAYSGEWVVESFRAQRIKYLTAERPKSQLYLESLPLWARGQIIIPDHARLIRELRLLERRTHRSGRDTVDHGRSGHDDLANVVCGCAVHAATDDKDRWFASLRWVTEDRPASDLMDDRRNLWHHPNILGW